MPRLIDSHCHLTYDGLYGRIEQVIENAQAAGVDEFVTIATDIEDAARVLELHERWPRIHVVCGIHPHQAGKAAAGWDGQLARLANRPDVHAVGEMGLDYHYDFSDRASQERVFARQLEIAEETGKPVVIHCREAHAETLATLRRHMRLAGVVFHCFTGTLREADEILERGYWISLTGVVTFKKSDELRAVARRLPAKTIMVETDSPYLSPEPVRNVRPNEPAHLVHTARCIAQARDMDEADFAALTVANTRRFFRLPGGEGRT